MTAARNEEEPARGGTPETGSEKIISPHQALASRENPTTDVARLDLDAVREALDPFLELDGEVSVGAVAPRAAFRSFPTTLEGLEQATEHARRLDEDGAPGVYVRASTIRPGTNGRGSEADTAAVASFALDVDLAHPTAHRSPTLPPDGPTALAALRELELPAPTEVVHSGHGLYPRWVLAETTADLERAKRLAVDLHALARAAWAARDWTLDATTDLARVFRLPGTVNRKVPTAPVMCRVLETTGEVYGLDELEAAVRAAAPVTSARSPRIARDPRAPSPTTGLASASSLHEREWVEARVEDELRELARGGTVDFRQRLFGAAAVAFRAVDLELLDQVEAEARLAAAISSVWGARPNGDDRRWIAEARRKASDDPWRLSRPITPEEDVSEAVSDDQDPVRRLVATTAAEVKPRRIRWAWDRRVVLGGLTLLAGREGLGKSTIAVDLAAQVTRGSLPGELEGEARTVIYLHTEDARDFTVVPRLRAAGADLGRVLFLDARTPNGSEDRLSIPRDTLLLEAVIREHNAGLVVLDAATSLMDGQLDGDRDRQMRQALEPIGAMADRAGCAVLGLVHFGKRDSRDTGRLILGSIAWSQVARSVVAVAKDEDSGDLVVSTTKANLAPGDSPSLGARLVDCPVETEEGVTHVGRVEWLGETDRTATDLLAESTDGEDRADRTRAEEWLEEYLTEYDRPKSADVKKAAREADIPERTLQRARKKLGVLIETEGVSASGSTGPKRTTVWTLPPDRAAGANLARAHGTTGTTGSTGADQHERSGPDGTTADGRASGATRATPTHAGTTDQWSRSGEPVEVR